MIFAMKEHSAEYLFIQDSTNRKEAVKYVQVQIHNSTKYYFGFFFHKDIYSMYLKIFYHLEVIILYNLMILYACALK